MSNNGFCSNHAFYSLSLLFTFTFFKTRFDSGDYYFELNLSLLLLKSVAYKKAYNFVLQSSKHKEITFPHDFIFSFIPYVLGATSSKNVVKSGVSGKKKNRGNWPYSGVVYSKGVVHLHTTN